MATRTNVTWRVVLVLAGALTATAACGTAAVPPTPHWTSSIFVVGPTGGTGTAADSPSIAADSPSAAAAAATRTPKAAASKSPQGGGGKKATPTAADDGDGGGGGNVPAVGVAVPHTDFPGTIILGAPTDGSVLVSVMPDAALSLYVEFGSAAGSYLAKTDVATAGAMTPVLVTLSGLPSDAAIHYRVRYRESATSDFAATKDASFHTQRPAGTGFTFSVEADPHINIDSKTQPDILRAALGNIASAHPDFLVDLGDTFLGDKFAQSHDQLAAQYRSVRDYFGIVGPNVPLYLVNGNHEGEAGWARNGTADNLDAWAVQLRHIYYPLPTAGGFYSGSSTVVAPIGRLDSYYAWTWGDCLFVTLDLYNFTMTRPGEGGDGWLWTLGEEQYRWLTRVLSTSTARYKFVFAHHVIGDIRGGVEVASLYEWGGHDKSGNDVFAQKRPGWGLPITQLFEQYGVTIFFQGHDHLYVKQDRNGVVYQEVPQPATPDGASVQDKAHEEAYTEGVLQGSPGHLDVTVSASGVKVDYIRASTTSGASGNGSLVYSYTVAAK
jgi:hypothetical protein